MPIMEVKKKVVPLTCPTVNLLAKRGILAQRALTNGLVAGRLAHFRENWLHVTSDKWVLDTIQGYRIEFLNHPTQTHPPRMGVTSSQEQVLVLEEIHTMLEKGAIVELPKSEQGKGFYSTLFLIPKKGGGMRPVIDLKCLNEFIPAHHFKMEDFIPSETF